jgi:hypothetical protein
MSSTNGSLKHYDKIFLKCRALRHAWRCLGVVPRGGQLVVRLKCRDCDTGKETVLTARGEIVSSRFIYPEEYRVKGGFEGASVRREFARRLVR